jgi:hypothetical protein
VDVRYGGEASAEGVVTAMPPIGMRMGSELRDYIAGCEDVRVVHDANDVK